MFEMSFFGNLVENSGLITILNFKVVFKMKENTGTYTSR